MDRPTRTQVWYPTASDTLIGRVRQAAGLVTMIETDDGLFWVLDTEAENQVIGLRPQQGQLLKVMATPSQDRWSKARSIKYAVELLDRETSTDDGRAELAMANRYPYSGDLSPMLDWATDD